MPMPPAESGVTTAAPPSAGLNLTIRPVGTEGKVPPGDQASGGDWYAGLPLAPQQSFAAQQAAEPQGVKPSFSSLGKNAAAGANRTIASGLGAPVDLAAGGLNLGIRGINALAGTEIPQIQNPVGGSESIQQLMGLGGFDPSQVQPQNEAERIAQGVGAGAAAVPLMGMGAAGVAGAAPASLAGRVAGTMLKAPLPSTAVLSGAGGGAGQAAEDAAPEPYKPIANIGGQILGAGGAAAAGGVIKSVLGGIPRMVGSVFRPMTVGGQQLMAGQRILSAATNPGAVRAALANGPEELVPGSQPTTYQQTGDYGLGQLERGSRTGNEAPFLARAAQQTVARNATVEGLAQGNPGSVGAYLASQLQTLDQLGEQATGMGRTQIQGATDALGGMGTPQEYGAAARGSLDTANQAAKDAENRLWGAINPDGTAGVAVTGLKRDVAQIAAQTAQSSKPISGEEAAILGMMKSWPDVQPLNEVRAMRGRITDATREQVRTTGSSEDAIVRRLSLYRRAIDHHLAEAAERQQAFDQQEVAAGRMAPEATLEANLRRDSATWQNEAHARAAGTDSSQGFDRGANQRASGVSGVGRAAGAPGGGSIQAPGNQGVPGQPLRPLTPTELERYHAARQATAERKETYRSGTVGDVLESGDRNGFRVADSDVSGKFFNSSPRSREDVEAYLRAGGNPAALRNAAVASLRQVAINPDGTINPGAFDRWVAAHRGPLSAFPELRQQFADARGAQETYDNIVGAHERARGQYLDRLTQSFLNEDPIKAVGKAIAAGPQDFERLVARVRQNPDAMEGLKRAAVEFIQSRMKGTTEAGDTGVDIYKSDAFQKFIRDNRRPLRALFGPEGLNNLEMVAADLRRSNRSIAGSKIPGQSNTAQDMHGALKHGSFLQRSQLIMAIVGEHVGEHLGGMMGGHEFLGALAGVAPLVVNAFRQAGIERVGDLVRRAMLDPELARMLVQKVPPQLTDTFQRRLASRVIAQLPPMAATNAESDRRQ